MMRFCISVWDTFKTFLSAVSNVAYSSCSFFPERLG